jgi:hypothetical protein
MEFGYMLIYTVNKRFFSSALGIYIPAGAIIYRYENSTKLGLEGVPQEDSSTGITTSKFEYDQDEKVTWFYLIEGDANFVTLVGTVPEDAAGGAAGVGPIVLQDLTTIASPIHGMMAYNFGTNKPAYYNGTMWVDLS